jgi:NAD(P)-dependent dehydrogenase (short-subunit alcohol dehydrogenase family)
MNTAVAPFLSESFSLYDRVVVVASNDVISDAALPESLVGSGAFVIFAGRNLLGLERASRELSLSRTRAIFLDSTKKQSCREALASVVQRYGRVDVLVNVLGMGPAQESLEPSESALDDWQRTLTMGLGSAYLPSEVFGTYMSRQGRGSIVNLARATGLTPSAEIADIALTTRYLSETFANDGVRVNAIFRGSPTKKPHLPPFVAQARDIPTLSRMPEPSAASSALLFLAADASAQLSGTTLLLD